MTNFNVYHMTDAKAAALSKLRMDYGRGRITPEECRQRRAEIIRGTEPTS